MFVPVSRLFFSPSFFSYQTENAVGWNGRRARDEAEEGHVTDRRTENGALGGSCGRTERPKMSNNAEKHTTLAQEIGASLTEQSISWTDSLGVYFTSWWRDCRYYEDRMLRNLPFYRTDGVAVNGRRVEVIDTDVSDEYAGGRDRGQTYIHEVCIINTAKAAGDGEGIDIVLVHGYAAALGFFYTNLEGLSSIPGCRLHAIDMLGFGCSGRPSFPAPAEGTTPMKKVLDAEAFFVDSFERWRLKRGIRKCHVIAHSLGGYLMSCYYLKYGRDVVEKLVLVSPVGVEDNDMSAYNRFTNRGDGEGSDDDATRRDDSGDVDGEGDGDGDHDRQSIDREYRVAKNQGVDLTREFTDHLHDGRDSVDEGQSDEAYGYDDFDHDFDDGFDDDDDNDDDNDDNASLISVVSGHTEQPTRVEELMRQIKTRVRPGKFLTRMWEWNYTPIDIVRWFGPFAGKVVAIWVYNRFARVGDPRQLWDICMYTTRMFLEPGSGEYCLGPILAPGSLGRLPLLCRLPKQVRVPVLLLYGELDWMDKTAGYSLCKAINSTGGTAKFRIVPHAGHHLYVDNRAEFERQVLKFFTR